MKKILIILLLFAFNITFAQEVATSGFLMPRKTTAERVAFPSNTAKGIHVYDTDTQSTWYYDGTVWHDTKPTDTYLGNKTIHHNTTSVLAITHTLHNNADVHVESTGELSITNTAVNDGTNFYITNTTGANRSLSFTGFSGAYLRNGGTVTDVSGTGLTLKANTRYLAHITDNGGNFYFNATEAGGGLEYYVQDLQPTATEEGEKWLKPSTGESSVVTETSVEVFIKANAKRFLLAEDANGTGSTPTDGASIATWKDLTGNNNDAAMTGVTYNATESALQVDVADVVTFTGAMGTGAKNLFFVLQKRAGGDVNGRTMNATNQNTLVGHWETAGDAIYINGNPSSLTGVAGENLTKRVYGLEYLNDNSLIYRGTGNDILTDATANSLNGVIWGLNTGTFNEPTDMYIQAYVEFDTALTTDQREQVEAYLAHKFGIDADLPTGHTYKSAAPTSSLSWKQLAATDGKFKDSGGSYGTAGQILSSTASGTNWIDDPSKSVLPIHADNAAALAAGLVAGERYHNGDGIVRVVF